jgi:hypothetical protein
MPAKKYVPAANYVKYIVLRHIPNIRTAFEGFSETGKKPVPRSW